MTPADFPSKLDLALKAFSLSQGRLAADLGVSKSLVSRWVSGTNAPAGHNLTALTSLIAARRDGFTLLDWDRSLEDLAGVLGVKATSSAEPVPSGAAPEVLPSSRMQSRVEVQRDGHAYPGVYVGFRQSFRNNGQLIGDLVIVWCKDQRLYYRHFDPAFSHRGEAMILRHQLFMFGEDDGRIDGLAFHVLNGVVGQKAMRMDGLAMSVHGDRLRTPGASPIVLQRLLDLADEQTPPADDLLAPITERLRGAFERGGLGVIAGPAIVRAISPVVGAPSVDGLDHLLRVPGDRSLSASELDWTPALASDVHRVREAMLGTADCFPIYGGNGTVPLGD